MARAPNKKAEEARELYQQGMSLVEIAKKLNTPAGTVRRWKSTYKWDAESERSDNKANARKENKSSSKKPVAREIEVVPENAELTENQRLFCLLYVKYRNKVKAYQKAFHCSYECACGNASSLWKNIEIQKYINRLLEEYRSGIDIEIQDLFQWYLDIARADINDFISIKDNVVQLKSEIDGMIVTEISNTQNGIKVKLSDRMKAMEWLGEHIDIASEKQRAELELLKVKKEALNHENEGAEDRLEKFFAALEDELLEGENHDK